MRKLKAKKGNMIIEGIASLCIISLLLFSSFDIYLTSYKLNAENKIKDNCINVLDMISKEIIYNKDYHFLEELKNQNRLYMAPGSISTSSVENNDINDLFIESIQDQLPYLYINIEDGDIYKVRLYLYYKKYNGLGEIHSDLFKGKY
jgi:hypothetical protein